MKKLLSVFLLTFLLFSTTFADFKIETKLSTSKQEAFKLEIDKIYKQFDTTLSKLATDRQQVNLETIIGKIDDLVLKQKDDTTIFVLKYLQYLLKEKLEFVNSVDLGEILKLDEKDKEDIKKEEAPIVVYVPTPSDNGNTTTPSTPTIAKCYVSNGEGQEKFINGSSQGCEVVSCNYGYEKIGNQCLILCGNNTHREGMQCVSNEKTCDVINGSGKQSWGGNSYGSCNVNTCNEGYFLKNNYCEKIDVTITKIDLFDNVIQKGLNNVLVSKINLYSEFKELRFYGLSYNIKSNNENSLYGNAFATLYIDGQAVATQTIKDKELLFGGFSAYVVSLNDKNEVLPKEAELKVTFTESFTGTFQIELTDIKLHYNNIKFIQTYYPNTDTIFTIE